MMESADNHHTAPAGWKKKVIPKKSGAPKNDVVFVAPTGEEFKAKRTLERYLKANPGGPSIIEFDWSTGEITPTRRSARISEKEKHSPVKTTESGSTKNPKRVKKSHGDSGDAQKQEAGEKEEEMQDVHHGQDTVKAETGEEENEDKEEGKDSEAKPEIFQEEKVDEPIPSETNEIAYKTEDKPVVEPQIHPDEGALKEHSVVENEEKPKDLDNNTENGFDGKNPVENYDQEKHLEPVKEVQKAYEGKEVQKAQEMDSSTNHSEAKQPPRTTFNVVS